MMETEKAYFVDSVKDFTAPMVIDTMHDFVAPMAKKKDNVALSMDNEEDPMSYEEFLELTNDKTEKGVEKLLKKFYGKEFTKLMGKKMAKKVIGGVAGMFWAHIEAPMHAFNGKGQEAVDSAVGAVGALAGGIIGGPPGALVGTVVSIVPGWIIDYFDTGHPRFEVIFTNVGNYHVRFTSYQTDWNKYSSVMYAYTPGDVNGKASSYHGVKDISIPQPITYRKSKDKVEYFSFTCPMTVHSKYAYASFQLEAYDSYGNVKKTYDVAFQYPGSWWGYKHYVGIWENASWPRSDRNNYKSMEHSGHQGETGEGNRPSQGSSNESKGYWNTWDQLIFELA